MKRLPVIIIGIVILSFGVTYFIFLNKVEEATIEIEKLEQKEKSQFIRSKDEVQSSFEDENKEDANLFSDYYEESKGILIRDTIVSYFVYSEKLQIQGYGLEYLNCLNEKCLSLIKNKRQDVVFESEFQKIENQFGEIANQWLNKIGKNVFFKFNENEDCSSYFEDTKSYTVNQSAFREFLSFLNTYKEHKKNTEQESQLQEYKFSTQLNKAKYGLNSSGKSILEDKLQYNSPLSIIDKSFTYNGEILGVINYSFPSKSFNESSLQSAVDYAFEEQYKNNSLYTGAKPYGYCYGSNNSCSSYGCSRVDVSAGGSDVLVLIKDRSEKVVRHGYIKSGGSYQFNIPNGSYQVFFYSGKGWNPNKFMKNTYCGELKGGFVSSESITKDSRTYISNQILTYELIMQQNGNFSTQSSSKNEAF